MMKVRSVLLLVVSLTMLLAPNGSAITFRNLFRNSYSVFETQRNAIGVYRDSTVFSGANFHPGSTANVGMGLVSLCIADRMGWDGNARAKAIQTVRTMVEGAPYGANGYFYLDRNAGGVGRHFFDLTNGSRAWNSEYSTIDMAIYMAGAFFAKRHFADGDLTYWVDRQYREVDWGSMIANVNNGTVYREMWAGGTGVRGSETNAFNEYMLVAYFAYRSENGNGGPATRLWNRTYGNIGNLPKSNYWGYEVLTDAPNTFVSDFAIQFCYFLCPNFNGNTTYVNYLRNAYNADREWFSRATNAPWYSFGLGAGTNPDGYHADKIGDNPYSIVSPHVQAGFIPIAPNGVRRALLRTFDANKGIYRLNNRPFLWRYSLDRPRWRAGSVQGVDFASAFFGIASHPDHLGTGFFTSRTRYQIPRH